MKMLRVGKLNGFTEVMTDKGPVQVRKLAPGMNVYTLNEHTETPELHPVHEVRPVQAVQFWRINCREGQEVTISADGMIWTADGWHELSCFNKGREILQFSPGISGSTGRMRPRFADLRGSDIAFSVFAGNAESVLLANGAVVHL